MFNFFDFLFSLLKGIYNTCTILTQLNKQASVPRILFAELFGILSTSINKIRLDYQLHPMYMIIHKTKKNTTPAAPQIHTLHNNYPLSLVPRNYRNIALTEHISTSHSYPQSPVTHSIAQQPNVQKTYEQIIEQPHTTNFPSQNNRLFSPR